MKSARSIKALFPFVGDQYGGSSISSLHLASALQKRGHEPVMVLHGEGRMADAVKAAGFVPILLRPLSRHATEAKADRLGINRFLPFLVCAKLIHSEKAHIVHVNDLNTLRIWPGPTRLSSAKFVAHWRSNYKKSVSVDLSLAMASHVIAISDYSRDRLPERVRRKASVEYNPFEQALITSERKAALRQRIGSELGLPADALIVGCFGSLKRRKRTHVLADVLNALPNLAGRPLYGLACGPPGEPADTLLDEKIGRFGLEKRLIKTGFVSPPTDWMAACDVVIAPAEQEPFGRVPFEAAQAGTPVIMSSDSGAAELIEHGRTGLLVDPLDEDGWIAAVRGVLLDPSEAKALVSGGRTTLRELSPERHAERIEERYRAVLSQGG
ncbi:glycosyltransferase family 4 protein [Sphingobium sp. CR28]|uniref:glycosyltransferase family 4 protein n=1 Tax=Sphingobium sp. CR28 TaxID=3400272 RepID=UPI003FED61E7